MFPVTPKPGATESLRGYQLRLAERNGYPTPKWIVDTLQGSRAYGPREVRDATPLHKWAGLSDAQVASLTMRGQGQKYRLRGIDLDRRAFRLNRPKVCPRCLAENGWCEGFWDLRLAIACPIHHTMLIDRCDKCGHELSWHRSKVSQCRCGQDLTSLPTADACKAVCDVMAVLRHAVYRDDRVAPLPPSMQHLHRLGLHQLHRLLSAFSIKCGGHIDEAEIAEGAASERAAVESAAKILANWPSGLHEFLDREIAPSVQQNGALPRYNSFLGWLAGLDKVANDEEHKAFAFLEEEVRHHLVGALASGALERCMSNGSCVPDLQPTSAGPTANSGGTKRGVSAANGPRSGAKRHIAWSGSASALLVMPLQAAADQLGMSIETLRALRDVGAFDLSLRGARRTHVSRDAVNKLHSLLRSWIPSGVAADGQACLTMAQAFAKFGALRGERAAFFVWLAGCPHRVVGCASSNGDADALRVDASDVSEFFDGLRSRSVQAA